LRGLPATELVKCLPDGESAECFDNFPEAMKAARNYGGPILVAGSLFLVGEARAELLGGDFLASAQ
jgi:folylpolyglutamate synthase/dihydropteroate synthase